MDLWGTLLHVGAVFFMTVSAVRTFTFNQQPAAAAIEPPPNEDPPARAMRLLHTADECTFEYDMRSPHAANNGHRASQVGAQQPDRRYSAIIIRPRDSAVVTDRARARRQTWDAVLPADVLSHRARPAQNLV